MSCIRTSCKSRDIIHSSVGKSILWLFLPFMPCRVRDISLSNCIGWYYLWCISKMYLSICTFLCVQVTFLLLILKMMLFLFQLKLRLYRARSVATNPPGFTMVLLRVKGARWEFSFNSLMIVRQYNKSYCFLFLP